MDFPSDAQLDRLVAEGCSDRVARRRSAGRMQPIRKNLCALANDLPGHAEPGVLLIGVDADGVVADREFSDRTLQRLADLGRDGTIVPLPTLGVQKRRLRGREIVVILVEPSEVPPVRSSGVVWVRVGPTTRAASPEEERLVGERRRARDEHFDRRPAPGATLSDLDEEVLRRYLPLAVASRGPEFADLPAEGRLRTLGILSGEERTPTWGSLLAFGRSPREWLPGAYVHFLHLDGERRSDGILRRKVFAGRLSEVLPGLEGELELAVTGRAPISGGERGSRRPAYPIGALRELVRNALMHRSYETNVPVRVHRYRDRVEVRSPGALYGMRHDDGFRRGMTGYRNPLVAEIMVHLGFARRFGTGIPMIRRDLERNGNPEPEFRFSPAGVTAVVRAAS